MGGTLGILASTVESAVAVLRHGCSIPAGFALLVRGRGDEALCQKAAVAATL